MEFNEDFYEYICIIELVNQCENRYETPLRILYSPTGDHYLVRKHFLYYDELADKYGIYGKFLSVEYSKNTRSYTAKFEYGNLEIPTSANYNKYFLYEKNKR
jgi:hypothetical protein